MLNIHRQSHLSITVKPDHQPKKQQQKTTPRYEKRDSLWWGVQLSVLNSFSSSHSPLDDMGLQTCYPPPPTPPMHTHTDISTELFLILTQPPDDLGLQTCYPPTTQHPPCTHTVVSTELFLILIQAPDDLGLQTCYPPPPPTHTLPSTHTAVSTWTLSHLHRDPRWPGLADLPAVKPPCLTPRTHPAANTNITTTMMPPVDIPPSCWWGNSR